VPLAQSVTWIKVEKPVFDLVGVVLNSLGLAAICALVAFTLGTALGLAFIARRRREAESWAEGISLHL
jgi:ABC-type spermidine/putrescine transport system permease subunit II